MQVFDKFWSMDQIGSKLVSVCVPLGIHVHLESINAVSDNIIIINCTTRPKKELCSAKLQALWANGVPSKTLMWIYTKLIINIAIKI